MVRRIVVPALVLVLLLPAVLALASASIEGKAGARPPSLDIPEADYRVSSTDLTLPTPGHALPVTRTYHSRSRLGGLFGYGWHSGFDMALTPTPDGVGMVLTDEDGSEVRFVYDRLKQVFVSRARGPRSIEVLAAGGFVMTVPGGKQYHFDRQGALRRIVDLNGNEWRLLRSVEGRIESVQAPGSAIRLDYDEAGRLASLTDSAGNIHGYRIDERGDLVAYRDLLGRTTRYAYDGEHNLTEVTFPDGSKKALVYDLAHDYLVRETGPGNFRRLYEYDIAARRVKITDGNQRKTEISLLDGGRRVIRDQLGGETVLTFSQDDLLLARRDPEGNETRFQYDERGNLAGSTDALGREVRLEYHPDLNLPVAVIDPLGHRSALDYDRKGNLISLVTAGGGAVKFAFDRRGKISEFTSFDGRIIRFEYDKAGNLVKTADGAGTLGEAVYDEYFRVTKKIFPGGTWLSFHYLPNGMVDSVTDSSQRTTRVAYDELDRVMSVVDPEGAETRLIYDESGNLRTLRDPRGATTRYEYDAEGNMVSLTDPNGNTTRYRYDGLGRLVEKTDAGNNRFSWKYDGAGRLVEKTDAVNRTLRYRYNTVGNLLEKLYPNGADVRFAYDAAGRLISVQGPQTSLTLGYDLASRLVSRRDDVTGLSLDYERDAAGRITKTSIGGDRSIGYRYDDRGRLSLIVDPAGGRTELSYDRTDHLLVLKRPNGVSTRYDYDEQGRLASLRHQTAAGELLASVGYTFDRNDRRASSVRDGEAARLFGYDAAGQLVSIAGGTGTPVRFVYDDAGNRVQGGEGTSLTFNRLNQLADVAQTRYKYDPNGNLAEKSSPEALLKYHFDDDGNLAAFDAAQGNGYVYGYDAFGYRARRSGPDGQTLYLYDRENIFADLSAPKEISRLYIHGPGTDDLIAAFVDGKRYEVLTDGSGSVLALADAKGRIVSRYSYDAFGKVTVREEKVPIPFLYAGALYDRESDLYYLRSRAYDPVAGRFISPDVIDVAGGTNLYRYCLNDPVNFVDPTGKIVGTTLGTLIGGVVGGLGAMARHQDVWAGIAGGATSGAIAGAALDITVATAGIAGPAVGALLVAGAAGGGLGSAAGNYVQQGVTNVNRGQKFNTNINTGEIAVSGATGVVFGAMGGAAGAFSQLGREGTRGIIQNLGRQLETQTAAAVAQGASQATINQIQGGLVRGIYNAAGNTAAGTLRMETTVLIYTEVADEIGTPAVAGAVGVSSGAVGGPPATNPTKTPAVAAGQGFAAVPSAPVPPQSTPVVNPLPPPTTLTGTEVIPVRAADRDKDGIPDYDDGCPDDPYKTKPGVCGCGTPDADSDGDRFFDCIDECPNDPKKRQEGDCGCGTPDTDTDHDGTPDCNDKCPSDPNKTEPEECGCGTPDKDTDGDGTADCIDQCPNDPKKTEPGRNGCGTPEASQGTGGEDSPFDGNYEDFANTHNQRDKNRPGPQDTGPHGPKNGGFTSDELEHTLDEDITRVVTLSTECDSSRPCGPGQECRNGKCVQGPCAKDQDCPAGQVCDGGKCRVRPAGPCAKDQDCAADETCVQGKCQKKPAAACVKDQDCPAGQSCVNGKCEKQKAHDPATQCTKNTDCPAGQSCVNGKCQKGAKSPPPTPLKCDNVAKSGGNNPEQFTVQLGNTVGLVTFTYDMFSVPDQMTVTYGGKQVVNTGCIGAQQKAGRGSGSATFMTDGTNTTAKVSVNPSCEGGSTQWTFTLGCPITGRK